MPESATDWVSLASAWLATYFVHSTLLLLTAWVAARFLDRRPRFREMLWKTALCGGIVTASLQIGLGVIPLGGQVDLAPSLSEPVITAARAVPTPQARSAA